MEPGRALRMRKVSLCPKQPPFPPPARRGAGCLHGPPSAHFFPCGGGPEWERRRGWEAENQNEGDMVRKRERGKRGEWAKIGEPGSQEARQGVPGARKYRC